MEVVSLPLWRNPGMGRRVGAEGMKCVCIRVCLGARGGIRLPGRELGFRVSAGFLAYIRPEV